MARRMNVPSFVAQKGTRRLVCLTAYDVLTAGIVDEAGVDLILIEEPPSAVDWQAINDRLHRATHQKVAARATRAGSKRS